MPTRHAWQGSVCRVQIKWNRGGRIIDVLCVHVGPWNCVIHRVNGPELAAHIERTIDRAFATEKNTLTIMQTTGRTPKFSTRPIYRVAPIGSLDVLIVLHIAKLDQATKWSHGPAGGHVRDHLAHVSTSRSSPVISPTTRSRSASISSR